jgi:orotate phosphoribosyltransferase-like protein
VKELWKKFKLLTGYNGQDAADAVNISRQHISYLTVRDNAAITNKSAISFWMDIFIDRKIAELENKISALKQLKTDLRKNIVSESRR